MAQNLPIVVLWEKWLQKPKLPTESDCEYATRMFREHNYSPSLFPLLAECLEVEPVVLATVATGTLYIPDEFVEPAPLHVRGEQFLNLIPKSRPIPHQHSQRMAA